MLTKKLWLTLAALLVLAALLLLVALPALTRWALVEVLERQLNGVATIEAVDLALHRGALTITAMEASDNSQLSLRSGSLRGDIGLRDLLGGDFSGEVELNDAVVGYGDLAIKLGRLHFSGQLQRGGTEEAPEWLLQGDLALDALGVFDPVRELSLLTLGSARLTGLEINTASTAVSIPQMKLNQLGAVNPGEDDSRWLYGENFLITDFRFGDDLLEIGAIDATGLRSAARITAEGELESQGVLTTSLAALSSDDSPAEETSDQGVFNYRIGSSVFRDSEIHFTDQQFPRPLELTLLVEKLSLGTVDSRQPASATTLDLNSRIGEFSRIDVSGSLTPLAETIDANLQGNIEALPLPMLSPYVEQLLGYELSTGQFDHDFDINIEDEQLTAENKITLHGLNVKYLPDSKPDAPLGMPLELGLNMLRDSSGKIELDVPLEGHLDDPAIGIDQIVSTALTKALTAGSSTMLKLVLQPYGAIWMGAEMGMAALGRVRLDPMAFSPLNATMESDQLGYADKLGELLLSRPGISLNLCGLVGQADHAAMEELATEESEKLDLVALAKSRATAVKSYLAAANVEPKRLLVCKARVDPEGDISGVKLEI